MKARPAIAMIGQIGGGLFGNGVPVFLNLLNVLSQRFDVSFYSLMVVDTPKQTKGLTIHSISKRKLPLHLKYLLLLARLISHHIRNPYDVIYAVSAFPAGRMAIVLGWILRRPVIIHLIVDEMVSMPEIGYGQLLNPKLKRVNKWVCEQASELIVLSEYHKLIVQKNLGKQREIQILPLGIDVTIFPYGERDLSEPVQFIHVANYLPVKDQATLFQAFALLGQEVDCRLTVVGDGFQNQEVRKTLEKLNLTEKISFLEGVRNDQMQFVYSKMHIMLHSSRFETGSTVVLEAMASGVAVCATAVGFLADEKDAAEIVQVANPRALADAAMKLVRNQSRYNEVRSNAKSFMEKYSADYTGNGYSELISRVVGGSSSK
jgi:glycosyltransferase involved in cell wall biosynthesis